MANTNTVYQQIKELKIALLAYANISWNIVHIASFAVWCFLLCVLLIQSANPKSLPVGIIVFAYVVRTSVPNFQKNQQKTMRENWRD